MSNRIPRRTKSTNNGTPNLSPQQVPPSYAANVTFIPSPAHVPYYPTFNNNNYVPSYMLHDPGSTVPTQYVSLVPPQRQSAYSPSQQHLRSSSPQQQQQRTGRQMQQDFHHKAEIVMEPVSNSLGVLYKQAVCETGEHQDSLSDLDIALYDEDAISLKKTFHVHSCIILTRSATLKKLYSETTSSPSPSPSLPTTTTTTSSSSSPPSASSAASSSSSSEAAPAEAGGSSGNSSNSGGSRCVLTLRLNESVDVFKNVLAYMYGVDPQLSAEQLVEFISVANKLQIQDCSTWIYQYIQNKKIINLKNVFQLLSEAEQRKERVVQQLCQQFLNQNMREAVAAEEFETVLSKETIVQVMRNYFSRTTPANVGATAVNLDLGQPTATMTAANALHAHIRTLRTDVRYMSPETASNTLGVVKLITLDQQVLYAHRTLLAARCSFFSSLFNGKYEDSLDQEIHLDQIQASSLHWILDYIYGIPVKPKAQHQQQQSHHQNQKTVVVAAPVDPVSQTILDPEAVAAATTSSSSDGASPASVEDPDVITTEWMNLLKAANWLALPELEMLSLQRLEQLVNAKNCLELLHFAMSFGEHLTGRLSNRCSSFLKQSKNPDELIDIIKNLLG